jgi:hypothetical protein
MTTLPDKVNPDPCPHLSRALFRQLWSTGGGYHVAELCVACGCNVRGGGQWVPRAEVHALGIDLGVLPVVPRGEEQPNLFGGREP